MELNAQKLRNLKGLTCRAVVSGEFTFSEGRRSGNKVDFERVSHTPDGRVLLACLIPEVLLQKGWFPLDAIGGPDSGAYPISLAAVCGIKLCLQGCTATPFGWERRKSSFQRGMSSAQAFGWWWWTTWLPQA